MVNSTFGYFPGVPIFTSKDLVNWTQIGHVLDRFSQFNFIGKEMYKGIYAPAIEYNSYNDTFYMITTNNFGSGNFFVKTKDPLKGWSDPIQLPEVKHIDPSFFFDDDGKAYIVHNSAPETKRTYQGEHSVRIHEFDVENDKTIGKTKEIIRSGAFPADKPIWLEGPHLYKMNGYYYVMAAEGGTGDKHSEVIFRSKSPWGPYEAAAYNPILTQRSLPADRPNKVSSTGHADIIQSTEGDWWAVFLGVRPYEGESTFNTGRETFLLPVEWENGFPIINRKNTPVPIVVNKKNLQPIAHFNNGNFIDNQQFDNSKLDFSWIFIRTPQQSFHKLEKGKLIITPLPISIESLQSPSAVVRRQQHTNFSVETQMDFTPKSEEEFAGLVLFQNEKYQTLFGKTVADGKTFLNIYRIEKERKLIASLELKEKEAKKAIKLKVDGKGGKADFSYSLDGKKWMVLAKEIDATNLSTEKGGGFQGVTIGMYATSNHLNK
jgi:alpha-N-arabinofuranosidase